MARWFRLTSVVVAFGGSLVLLAPPAAAAAPTVTSLSPSSGGIGTSVTVTGTNFASPSKVVFGTSTAVTATYSSTTKITAVVPSDASSGPITVTTAGGTATSTAKFTVDPSLSIAPLKAPPGATLAMKGVGFAPFEAVDLYVGTTKTTFVTTDSAGRFPTSVTIPATAVPGPVWVSAIGRKSGYAAQKSVTVQTDWPQFGGSPAHPFVNMRENAITQSTVGTLDTDWTFDSGEASAFTTAAVVGGIVYWASSTTVWALDEATGAVLWKRSLGPAYVIVSSPAVVGGTVFIGTSTGVVALRAYNGTQLWAKSTDGQVYTSPAVAGGTVYVGAGTSLYAFDAATGATTWQVTLASTIYASPAVAGGRVFVGTQTPGTFYALSAKTGVQIWSRTIGDYPINGAATVYAGSVYFGGGDKLLRAYSASTGAPRWTYPLAAATAATAVASNGLVYIGDISNNFYAVTAASGSLRWSVSSGGGNGSATYANGLVFAAGGYDVTAFSGDYGGVAWSGATGGVFYSSPTLANGHLFVSDEQNGTLNAFEPTVRPRAAARPAIRTLHQRS